MMMTEREIVLSYVHAKYPRAQVHILAQLNGVGAGAIRDILRRAGADMSPRRRRTAEWTRESEDELVRLWSEGGLTYKEIGECMGVSHQAVCAKLKALGMTGHESERTQ